MARRRILNEFRFNLTGLPIRIVTIEETSLNEEHISKLYSKELILNCIQFVFY